MAYVALVSEGLGVIEAISRGWQVFRNNLANLTVIALILIIGGLFAGIILGLPIILVFAPFLLGMLANTPDAQNSGLIMSGICLVLALPVIILANGILHSYLQSAWTLAYQQLSTIKKPVARAKKK
jgi:MFS-type transporter involved in bile tolerance (Atg22 family)